MALSAPQLPSRFPCWCRAVYSWGGETKTDLGFVEGDLIECLNAGDGQWWMGRLRRDRRMVGLFPSNFVEVLGEDFVPKSRETSPIVKAGPSPIANPNSAPRKQKTVFRKPFQAHREALAPSSELARSGTTALASSSIPQIPPRDGSVPKAGKPSRARGTRNRYHSSHPQQPTHSTPLRRGIPSPAVPPSPLQQADTVRPSRQNSLPLQSRPTGMLPSVLQPTDGPSSSPYTLPTDPKSSVDPSHMFKEPSLPLSAPSTRQLTRFQPSPASAHVSQDAAIPATQIARFDSSATSSHPLQEEKALSPVPGRQYTNRVSQGLAPQDLPRGEGSPPPPPPHRVAISSQQPREVCLPELPELDNHLPPISRTSSPVVPLETNGNTPSPLRSAMEDVMSSLEDMGTQRRARSPTQSPSPLPEISNPWSPDAYDSFRQPSATRFAARPLTSTGFEGDHSYEHYKRDVLGDDIYANGPPQLNNYVQRMESRLRQLQEQNKKLPMSPSLSDNGEPPPPPKHLTYHERHNSTPSQYSQHSQLVVYKSEHDVGTDFPSRSWTNKSSTTNSSSDVQSNSTSLTVNSDRNTQSIMSISSAGAFSATSAGSFARRDTIKSRRPNTATDSLRSKGFSEMSMSSRPQTPSTGISYQSSHDSSRQGASSPTFWSNPNTGESGGVFGGLSTPKAKKHGFFKKIIESAKTGAANAKSSIAVNQNGGSYSPSRGRPVSPPRPSYANKASSRDVGTTGSVVDWVQVRRDVNRATSLSRNERIERAERCQMMDHAVIYAVEELHETAEGDESIDGLPISEPANFGAFNLSLVDKSVRFVSSFPPMTNPTSLAQGYICRPYKSDIQRLRAIFIWVSEKIAWNDPVDDIGVDMRRTLQTRQGSPQEVACLVNEMCAAVGLHAEAVQGYIKTPGELIEVDSTVRPNHWWNTVLIDGEWRAMDCSLASPTNPRRSLFTNSRSNTAEDWYFLIRPLEICYTHIPLFPEEQHICPPLSPDVLLALPTVCPTFFKLNIQFPDYDTSIYRINGLEIMQVRLLVPPEVECAAEVEAPVFARDAGGDFFASGDVVRKRALVQPDWVRGEKRFTIKAVLPGDEGQGIVKIYAGRKGLMHSNRDIPHPLVLALPIVHTGENPPYDFVIRHPTGHAQRNDLYIMQPQCARLVINNTFIFAIRQHPSSPPLSNGAEPSFSGRVSPNFVTRPASSLSMASSSFGGSSVSAVSNEFSVSTSAISSTRSGLAHDKPAKLAIQAPSGKIHRLTRMADHMMGVSVSESALEPVADGSVWETVIKIGEHGTWRGLVLADRVARWCVFCEWECY